MESDDTRKARIRALVEGKPLSNRCPLCQYNRYVTGKVHPFAGKHGMTRSQTRWCTGSLTVKGKGYVPVIWTYLCPGCGRERNATTQAEANVYAEGPGCSDRCPREEFL